MTQATQPANKIGQTQRKNNMPATYVIQSRGTEHSRHETEESAIEVAATIPASDEPSVVMLVESGEYASRTRVWPTTGATYTN